jgi:hypothetical protein
MKTINNTEPIPMIPQGCNGEWVWNGFEITSTFRDSASNELTQRKGKWMWIPQVDDSQNAWMEHATMQEISEHFKPKASDKINLAIAATIAIIIATLLIL